MNSSVYFNTKNNHYKTCTKKEIHPKVLNESKWNSKKYQVTHSKAWKKKEKTKNQKKQTKNNKLEDSSANISIITLNTNDLNIPI